jgi:hypothetical protein
MSFPPCRPSVEAGVTDELDREERVVALVNRGLELFLVAVLGLTAPTAGPFLAAGAELVFERRRERLTARMRDVASGAEEEATPEQIAAKFVADEAFEQLVFEAVEAARRSHWRAKRVLVGKAVGRAAADDALVDEQHLILAALRDLDAPHYQTLKRMLLAGSQKDRDGEHRVFDESHSSIKAALIRHGAVDAAYDVEVVSLDAGGAAGGGRSETQVYIDYSVSAFGQSLLADAETAANGLP